MPCTVGTRRIWSSGTRPVDLLLPLQGTSRGMQLAGLQVGWLWTWLSGQILVRIPAARALAGLMA